MRGLFKGLLVLSGVILIPACASTSSQPGFAPKPPTFYPNAYRTSERQPITTFTQANMPRLASIETYSTIEPASGLANIEPEAGPSAGFASLDTDSEIGLGANETAARCKNIVQFDTQPLVAYQWDRSRLGLDTESIAFGGPDNGEKVKLSYRLRLIPPKATERKCNDGGAWRGLITE